MKARWVHRRTDDRYRRFGGGWQWCLGVKASKGARTIVIELLLGSLRIERGER